MSATEEIIANPALKDGDDDDPPLLSSRTLEALREFLSEQSSASDEEKEEEVKLVSEDWRLSQFWYDRETAETICEEIRVLWELTGSSVACVACPTLYAYLKVKLIFVCFNG